MLFVVGGIKEVNVGLKLQIMCVVIVEVIIPLTSFDNLKKLLGCLCMLLVLTRLEKI